MTWMDAGDFNMRARDTTTKAMRQKTQSPDALSMAIMIAVIALPFVALTTLKRGIHSTMITDSIPDHGVLVTIVASVLLLLLTYMSRSALFYTRPMNGALTWVFAASSIMTAAYSNGFYKSAYEDYLFGGNSTSYSRIVVIDQLSQVHARHGFDFYGHVNPNNIPTIYPVMKISRALYSFWVKTRAESGNISSPASEGCSVRVTVNRSGNAERIVWTSLTDVPDVIKCY